MFSSAMFAGHIDLAWDTVDDPRVDVYEVAYGTDSGAYDRQVETALTSVTINGLQDGQTFYFAVRACDAARLLCSVFSSEVSATIPEVVEPPDVEPSLIGVFRPSNRRFYLDFDGSDGWTAGDSVSGPFGTAGDIAIIGDWNGNGTDDIGVFRPGNRRFYMDFNESGSWDAGDRVGSLGMSGDVPIIGDWNGNGTDDIGVFRPGNRRFYMDFNESGSWDGGDTVGGLGAPGDVPIIGKW